MTGRNGDIEGRNLPTTGRERIHSLDLLRGLALLGILCVNVYFLAGPMEHGFGGAWLAGESRAEAWCWGLVRVFCEAKFMSLFSLLFGAGMVIQCDRATARGHSPTNLWLRRSGVLLLVGLAHGLFLFYGDILFLYAIIGLLLLPFSGCSGRTMASWGVAFLVVSVMLSMLWTGLGSTGDTSATVDPSLATGLRGWEAIAEYQDPGSTGWMEAETAAYREGPFGDALAFRSVCFLFVVGIAFFSYGWRILGMFLLGAGLMKAGFFRSPSPSMRRCFVRILLPVGLALECGGVLILSAHGWSPPAGMAALAESMHSLGSIGVCLGYVGLCVGLSSMGILGKVRAGIARVGRVALSAYLLESLATNWLMNWWGLAMFDTRSRVELLLIAIGLYTVIVVLATGWLHACRIGPAEWAWRCLIYMRWLPLRREKKEPE